MSAKVSRRVVARALAAQLLQEPTRRSHWLRAGAAYLMEQHMVDNIDLFVNDLAHELYEQSGHLYVDVTSARTLTESVRTELRRTLQETTGASRVELSEHIDTSLLGGLVARTPDAELDASLRTKLKQLASL